jgi:hypothetical protein
MGEPCPIDAAPAGRIHCSTCPSFVSFRSSDGVATVGCASDEDVAGWLRREMGAVPGGGAQAPLAGRDSDFARRHRRPRAPRIRPRGTLRTGASLGLVVADFGVGLVLSAFERPD